MRLFAIQWIVLFIALLGSNGAFAETLYKSKYNRVRIVSLDAKVAGKQPVDHPQTISEAKLYNMLASLHFDKRVLILKNMDDVRLFDQRGLKMLTPYLVQAFQKVTSDQMVSFTYIKKVPHYKVFRNDRLIAAKCFVRGGELFIVFKKLYAKIHGDYQRADNKDNLNRARDIGVSLASMGGQRSFGPKGIALKLDHDYLSDLQRLAAEKEQQKRETEEKKEVQGIPLPTPSSFDDPYANEDDVARLKTLKKLRDKDLISEREYQAKKKKILKEF